MVVAFFIAWKILVILFALLAVPLLPLQEAFTPITHFGLHFPYLLWIFGNFDGMIYMSIAQGTYHSLENAFFPLYPLLIRWLDPYTSYPIVVDAQLVSNAAFLTTLAVIIKLLKVDVVPKLTGLLFLIVILFPTSMFYGAAYNDSTFFLFATLCLYFGRKKNYFFASLFGALATLTRLNGLALMFFLIFEYIFDKKTTRQIFAVSTITVIKHKISPQKIFWSQIFWVVLIPLTFVGYLIYTNLAFGDWNQVFSNMKIWHQDKVTFPLQVVWRYFKILVLHPHFNLFYWVAFLEAFMVEMYTFFLVWSFKKIRSSYWVFFLLSIIIPSLTGTFQGMPRYGLHVYPFFLTVALFLSNKPLLGKIAYFIVSILLMFFVITLFTRGYFVS